MTKKSLARLQRDAQRKQGSGVKKKKIKGSSPDYSRSWFELKIIHNNTLSYIADTATLFKQYANPSVLKQISENGREQEWIKEMKRVPVETEKMHSQLERLWDMHKDKRKLCLSTKDLADAHLTFEEYQRFHAGFFEVFADIIGNLNDIYNDAVDNLNSKSDPNAVTDVIPKIDVTIPPLPKTNGEQ